MVDSKFQKHALKRFLEIDKEYQLSAKWWFENTGICTRHIPRLRKQQYFPNFKTANKILAVVRGIEDGSIVIVEYSLRNTQIAHSKKTHWTEFCVSRNIGSLEYRRIYHFPSNAVTTSSLNRKAEYYPTKEHAVLRFNEIAKAHYGSKAVLAIGIPEIPAFTCEKCKKISPFVFCINIFPHGGAKPFDPRRRFFCKECIPLKLWRYCREFYAEDWDDGTRPNQWMNKDI